MEKIEMSTKCSIPVIDLNDFPNQSSKLIAACEEWGCFRLVNHHEVLPLTLMSEMKAVAKSLFDLPVEIKHKNVDVTAKSGYIAPTVENPIYEALGLYGTDFHREVETFCSQLDVSPHQREIVTKYTEAVHELFIQIAEKLTEGLGIKNEKVGFENWIFQFRMNKYNFTPQTIGSFGIKKHTDSSFLTLLQEDEDVDGLEVMDKSGHFIPVDPWPGNLIVNIGDVATIWSNGRFCNVKHRVRCKEATNRVSIASALVGPIGAIEPPPELVDVDHPRVYVPTTYEDYRMLRFSSGLQAGESLALLQTPSSEN